MPGYQILLIEDNQQAAETITKHLAGKGYRVITCRNSEEAWQSFRSGKFNLVVTDLNLPNIDGIKLCKAIKSSAGAKTPVIMIGSASISEKSFGEFKPAERPDRFLVKPFSLKLLWEAIHALLPVARAEEKPVAKPSPPVPLQGSLSEITLPVLLFHFHKKSATGILTIKYESTQSRIYLINGYPVFASSNDLENTLGRVLLRQEKITEKDYQLAIKKLSEAKTREPDVKLGEVLIGMKLLSPSDVSLALQEQVISVIVSSFELRQAQYSFHDTSEFVNNIIILKTPLEYILYQGIKKYYRLKMLEKELQTLAGKYLSLAMDFLEKNSDYRLHPLEERVVSMLNGQIDLSDLLAKSPLSTEDTLQLLYLLKLTEMLLIHDAPLKQAVNPLSRKSIADKTATESEPATAEKENIIRDYLQLKARNFYQILGVKPDAALPVIQEAYRQKSALYHPNNLNPSLPGGVRDHAAEILAKLSQAYKTLSNADQRKQYDRRLNAETKTKNDEKALQSELCFREGEQLMKAGKYAEAREKFSQGLTLKPDEPFYLVLLGWSTYLRSEGENAEDTAQAKEFLKRALTLNSRLETAYFYLGLIAKGQAKPDLARQYFQKATELNPRFSEAERELKQLKTRKK